MMSSSASTHSASAAGSGSGSGGPSTNTNNTTNESTPRRNMTAANNDAATTAKQKAESKLWSEHVVLSFPAPNSDPTASTFLACFKDDSSAYVTVAKACLQISQACICLSSAHMTDTSTVVSSALFHDGTFCETASLCMAALQECFLTNPHKDRKCRILAIKTLALLARSSYARVRHSPLLYALKDARNNRIEDEVGNEVPTALLTAALTDPDNGVSASAIEALGILILSSSPTVGTVVEDELWREMASLSTLAARQAPYGASLRSMSDEDAAIATMELSLRVMENIVAPRLVQLVDRVFLYSTSNQTCLALPCLTACLVHNLKTTPATVFGMDKNTFAKRWVDVDAIGLVDCVVASLLLPAVQFATSGALASCAALSLLRLAHACPQAVWVLEACRWSARVFKDELAFSTTTTTSSGASVGGSCDMEGKQTTLAALLIALRAVPLSERHAALLYAASIVATQLPSTVAAPFGSSASASVVVEWQGYTSLRRPARIALWTELALSYVVDGPAATVVSGSEGGDEMTSSSSSSTAGLRHELLHSFLTSGAVGKILQEKSRQGGVLALYDEILLAVTTVTVNAARRFRITADGTLLLVDPEAPLVMEWTKIARTVLTVFASCVSVGSTDSSSTAASSLLEEDQSMLLAGQANYMRLVQEYLYMAGLINPESSVSFKLTPNACPHLLWVQLSESAYFLSKFESPTSSSAGHRNAEQEEEAANKLMEELVTRETKQGVSSQHMRLYLLTLAADQWIQGRIFLIRKQFESQAAGQQQQQDSNGNVNLNLRVQTGRDILMAVSPKRLLAKMMESYTPPPDKKRDPMKKLAPEILKASVACIEGIALIACDWRRRFGSSQETKHLVSVAVGLLQGKVDETPADETMRALMAPVCEAAVLRIHAFYESESGGGSDLTLFPVSDLVSHHVKPKIKPLITSLKPPVAPKDKIARSYLMQLCQQIIAARIEQCIYSIPPADSLLASARPTNWLRLSVPPLPESKDARLLGNHGDVLAAWGTAVNLSSASSDAVAVIAAYTPRRYFRHDGEEEYRLAILVRAFNTTPVSLTEGLRLELGVYQKTQDPRDAEDPTTLDVIESLGGNVNALYPEEPLASSIAVYRQEIKAGDYVTWEVSLDQLSPVNNAVVMPSVVYRNIKVESVDSVAKWVGDKASGDASTIHTGAESKSGEDDFQVTSSGKGKSSFNGENAHTENVTFPGEPLFLSPMVGLQPCPLIFFRDAWGDVTTFRLVWFQLAYHVAPLRIASTSVEQNISPIDRKVAAMSSLHWHGEAIPSGVATKLWAFSSISGGRVLCVLAETEGKSGTTARALHFRGDDNSLLFSLTGSKASRESVVAALCPGNSPSA